MGIVITFRDYQPTPRTDDQPWVGARVEESTAPDGPWNTVQTITLDPVDEDPLYPQRRDITTTQATLEAGWFRVVFVDTIDGYQPTEPLYFGALPGGLSLDALKARLDKELDIDDALLRSYLIAADMQAQSNPPFGTGRQLRANPASALDDPVHLKLHPRRRRHHHHDHYYDRPREQRVLVPDARELTKIIVNGTETADFDTRMRNDLIFELVFTDADPLSTVEVEGYFGYLTYPEDLRDAIYSLAARKWFEREAQYADQVALAEGTAVQAYYRQLPASVRAIFDSYSIPSAYAGLS